jgi:hypothetical protein
VTIQGLNLQSLFGAATSNNGLPSLSSILGNGFRHHSFAVDSHGRVRLPTAAELNNAASPKDKLAIAGQLAEVIQVQADAAIKTGIPNRITIMTTQVKNLLEVVGAIVSSLTAAPTADKSGATDPLKPYRQSLSTVLGTLHSVLSEISALVPKATPSVAKSTSAAIQQLDVRGGALATQAGLVWPPLTAIGTTSAARATPTPNSTSLANIIA